MSSESESETESDNTEEIVEEVVFEEPKPPNYSLNRREILIACFGVVLCLIALSYGSYYFVVNVYKEESTSSPTVDEET